MDIPIKLEDFFNAENLNEGVFLCKNIHSFPPGIFHLFV
jgi:hypothetical protein